MDDVTLLRDLAREYVAACQAPDQTELRALWRQHNSLQPTRPLIYVRACAWEEMPASTCLCQDPLLRHYDNFFRYHLFWNSLGDDSIFEPWVTVQAVHGCSGWGVEAHRLTSEDHARGSYKVDYPIRDPDDVVRLRAPRHEIDEEATAAAVARVEDALGEIIDVNVDRGSVYRTWSADISTDLGHGPHRVSPLPRRYHPEGRGDRRGRSRPRTQLGWPLPRGHRRGVRVAGS
jgi:hypothetical protein